MYRAGGGELDLHSAGTTADGARRRGARSWLERLALRLFS
jgi:hypothetical protein